MKQPVSMELIKQLRERTGIAVGKCKEALEASGGDIDEAIKNLRKAGLASAVKKEGRETKEGQIVVGDGPKAVALVEINAETDFVVKNELFQRFAQGIAEQAAKSLPSTLDDFLSRPSAQDPAVTVDEQRAHAVQTLGENIRIRRIEILPKKPALSIGSYSHMGGKIVVVVEIEGADNQQDLARDIAMHIVAESPEYVDASNVPSSVLDHEREIARAQVGNKPPQVQEKIIEGKLNGYLDSACLLRQKYVRNPELTIAQFVEQRGKEKGQKLSVKRFIRWNLGE